MAYLIVSIQHFLSRRLISSEDPVLTGDENYWQKLNKQTFSALVLGRKL